MVVNESRRTEFEEGFFRHYNELYSVATRLCRNPTDAQDLVQETYCKAWASFHNYESNTNLRAWLFRIQMNTFINNYRRQRKEREILENPSLRINYQKEEEELPEQSSENYPFLLKTMEKNLAPYFREVLILYRDFEYKEMSEILGIPIGTVMSRLHRARKRMIKAMNRDARFRTTLQEYLQSQLEPVKQGQYLEDRV